VKDEGAAFSDKGSNDNKKEWLRAKDNLVAAIGQLGFPEELGVQIAKHLGSPKAMYRMTSYLYNERPKSAEIIVDEMLAISSEIESWKAKKAAEEANAKWNEIHYRGFDDEE